MYFTRFISPNLDNYTNEEFNILLEGSNSNNQVYDRRRSRYDDLSILNKVREKYPSISLTKFTNLPIEKMTKLIDDKS